MRSRNWKGDNELRRRRVVAFIGQYDLVNMSPADRKKLLKAAEDAVEAEDIEAERQAAAAADLAAASTAENLATVKEFAIGLTTTPPATPPPGAETNTAAKTDRMNRCQQTQRLFTKN